VTLAAAAILGFVALRWLGALFGFAIGGCLFLLVTWGPVWRWLPPHRWAEGRRRRAAEAQRRIEEAKAEARRREIQAQREARCTSPENDHRHRWWQGELPRRCVLCGYTEPLPPTPT
jgi:hypothetical protein